MEAETNLSNEKISEESAENINEQKISLKENNAADDLVSVEANVSKIVESSENTENIPEHENLGMSEDGKGSEQLENKNSEAVESGDTEMQSAAGEPRAEEDLSCAQKSDSSENNVDLVSGILAIISGNVENSEINEDIPQQDSQNENLGIPEEDKSNESLENRNAEKMETEDLNMPSRTDESVTEEDVLCSQKSDTLIRNIGELDLRQEIRESSEDPQPISKLFPNINPTPDPVSITTKSTADTQNSPAPVVLTSQNTSLGLLASEYRSSSTEESDGDDDDGEKSDLEIISLNPDQEYRNQVVEINSDTSDDSDIELVSQVSEAPKGNDDFDIDGNDGDNDGDHVGKPKKSVRAKGEFLLEDLPPIQDLHINVCEEECAELGTIESIVDQLVLVNSIPGTVPLDLDTILFLDKGKEVLGEVFDVLGQVCNPLYCVRFNSNKQIKERGIEVGQTVYVAPRTEHTKFIILPNLMRLRGSDASWEHDVEPSVEHLDYSDDEQERDARRSQRNKNRGGDDVDSTKKMIKTSPPPRNQQTYQERYQRPRYSGNNYQNQQRRPPYNNYQQQQHQPQHQQYQMHQPQYQTQQHQPQYQTQQHQHQMQQQPYNYDGTGSSWHMNYNNQVPQNFYPNPYAMAQHVPSNAMQQPLFPPTPPPPPPPFQ